MSMLDPNTYAAARVADFKLALGREIAVILRDVPTDLQGAPEELKVAIVIASQMRGALARHGIKI